MTLATLTHAARAYLAAADDLSSGRPVSSVLVLADRLAREALKLAAGVDESRERTLVAERDRAQRLLDERGVSS